MTVAMLMHHPTKLRCMDIPQREQKRSREGEGDASGGEAVAKKVVDEPEWRVPTGESDVEMAEVEAEVVEDDAEVVEQWETRIADVEDRFNIDDQRREDIAYLMDSTRLKLLQQILATDWGSLCAKELAARNEDLTESTIRDHLRSMTDRERPFVEKLEAEQREQGMPYTFYAVTEYGMGLLKQTGFYEPISLLYQAYEAAERPDDIAAIEEFEHRPTPDWL